jgi:hypothetical protein
VPSLRSPIVPIPTDIATLARRAGGYAWLEQELFALLGAWAATTAEPAAKVWFATASHRHGRRMQTWLGRLPELAEIHPKEMVGPADAGIAAVMAAATAAEATVDRVVASAFLQDELLRACREHAASVDRRIDGPTARILDAVEVELVTDLGRTAEVLGALVAGDAEGAGRVAPARARLQGLRDGAG